MREPRALGVARMLERRAKVSHEAALVRIAAHERRRKAVISKAHCTRRAFLAGTRWSALACLSSELALQAAAGVTETLATEEHHLRATSRLAQHDRQRWAQTRRALERRQERANQAATTWRV